MEQRGPVVQMTGITVEFPGVKALDAVDLRLYPGEVHALMGENGAGKSTLIKALTGVYRVSSGVITVAGERRELGGTGDAQDAGIATVYQEVNLCTNLSIGENVMLGHESRGPLGVHWGRTHARARQALGRLGLGDLDPRAPLSSLSIAVQQLVAISRAMVVDCKVLVLDEPTSSLDAAEVEQLFAVVRALREEGVAILFVSHFLDQIYAISDRLTVLRNGRRVGEYLTREMPRAELISAMIGKDAATLASLASERAAREPVPDEQPLLAARQIGRRGAIAPSDLEIYPGEIVGFAGLLGSGRTELARLLYGADRTDSGQMLVAGEPTSMSSPVTALAHRVAFSTENRRDEGIIADLSVRENLILALQAIRGWRRPLPRREQDDLCRKYIAELGIRPADAERPIKNLSGGNQQKVLLARWLATRPRLLILDEPTRGIDVGAKAEIQEAVIALAAEGMSVVFISSEIEEVVRLSDRIVVLRDRRQVGVVENGPDVSADTIVGIIAKESEAA